MLDDLDRWEAMRDAAEEARIEAQMEAEGDELEAAEEQAYEPWHDLSSDPFLRVETVGPDPKNMAGHGTGGY